MPFYRRNLPHWHPDGASVFLTWRLYGSLPASPRSTASIVCATKPSIPKDSPGREFKRQDSLLDKAITGPLWLKDPRIARRVMDTIFFGETKLSFYDLHAFVIMPNHVHLLITPHVSVSRLMNGLKGITAHEANAILRCKGNHFWQDESFDHWVRNSAEFDRIRRYIEWNPVNAKLLAHPEDWKWSSVTPKI